MQPLTASGRTETFVPASLIDTVTFTSSRYGNFPLKLFGAHAGSAVQPNNKFDVSAILQFSGAQRIAVLAFGKTTSVTMQGDWPNPSYDGEFLPVKQQISEGGFRAQWSVPFIARGVYAEGRIDTISGLGSTALGVSFVELADPYQSVTRSLKYVFFLGLVFSAYFVFEVTTGVRVHPAQYILVGVAQLVFYLLLLSIAERIGFDAAFALAAAATVGLISAYAGWIFQSRKQGVRALVVFTFVYALIYFLLRLEDQALLIGAVTSFAAIAAIMYFTRNIDWYSSSAALATTAGQPEREQQ